MSKLVIMDVTFNLMGSLNPSYMSKLCQAIKADKRVKVITKDEKNIHYISYLEDEIDFKMFQL